MASNRKHKNIEELVVQFFQNEKWEAQKFEDQPVYMAKFKGDHSEYMVFVQFDPNSQRLVVYAAVPAVVPPEKRLEVAEFITRANSGLAVGNLEMDFDEGRVRYRTGIDLHNLRLTEEIIHDLVYINLYTLDRHLPLLTEVVMGRKTPAEALQNPAP